MLSTHAQKVRLGSRNERREVYGRFLEAAIHQQSEVVTQLLYRSIVLPRHRARVRAAEAVTVRALAELELVGNTGPAKAATFYYGYMEWARNDFSAGALSILGHTIWSSRAEAEAEIESARSAFISACRRDLLYLPSWWQVWRPAWWRTRIKNARMKRVQKKAASNDRSGVTPD